MVYKTVNAAVGLANLTLSAAEVHGMASGMLCAEAQTPCSDWLKENFTGLTVPDGDRVLLERLFAETGRLLASDNFAFELLLPDDENALGERVIALKSWCQGFLYGVGMVTKTLGDNLETQEILSDISEFSKLDAHAEGEEDEQAYSEIIEYLRTAVMILRHNFSAKRT